MGVALREPRRGARISASFWIGIEGIDPQPLLRQGNLSASGMYFELEHVAGPAGSVQFLHIESEDRRVVVQVLARVIRATEIDDITRGKSIGLALEFMPASVEGRQNLERLVRHVVELGLRQEETIEHTFDVDVAGQQTTDRSTLQRLSVQRVVLETDWRAFVGDQMQVHIRSPQPTGESFPLDGQVTSVKPVEEGYRVEIRVTGITTQSESQQADEVGALTDLITQPFDDFSLPSKDHLSGLLSRIKLPTLLGLVEMERLSGELRFHNEELQEVNFFVKEGRLLDVVGESPQGNAPRELMADLMTWPEGQFQFSMEPVEREDRVQTGMTSLILDLAREEDEATQDVELDELNRDFF